MVRDRHTYVHTSKKLWRILIWWLQRQTTKPHTYVTNNNVHIHTHKHTHNYWTCWVVDALVFHALQQGLIILNFDTSMHAIDTNLALAMSTCEIGVPVFNQWSLICDQTAQNKCFSDVRVSTWKLNIYTYSASWHLIYHISRNSIYSNLHLLICH